MADVFGRGRVLIAAILLMILGVAMTMSTALPMVIGGIACMTFGFFAGHSVASGWVGLARQGRQGTGAALYLLAYYLGSSVIGSYGGRFWTGFGWSGVAGLVVVLLLVGLASADYLRRSERTT